MSKKCLKILLFLFLFISFMNVSYAENYKVKINNTGVRLRKGPGTNYGVIKELTKDREFPLESNTLYPSEEACPKGWYKIYYLTNTMGYVCSDYADIDKIKENEQIVVDKDEYLRPWTTPGAAIIGGAKYISKYYIEKGQYTSYLKKFNVNPKGSYSVYNHQYMANLAAPYSESYSSFKSYRDNDLLKEALEFTIPIYENMPNITKLPGKDAITTCQSEVLDQEFETYLDGQGFPETYKCKLRLLHKDYHNWIFIGMKTGLDFDKSVKVEKSVSSIQGGNIYYELTNGQPTKTENGWYLPNYETTAFYLDPRNFLVPERILMFENLTYNASFTESVISSILSGTFMADFSLLDNKTYAAIFLEAGVSANMNAVYLASLARQESGSKGGRATTGAEFTYKGITYKGLFNFYNIGANSSAESPVLAGLVWASGGSNSVIVQNDNNNGNTNDEKPNNNDSTGMSDLNPDKIASLLNLSVKNNCLVGIKNNTTYADLKGKLSNYKLNNDSTSILKTGEILEISDGTNKISLTITVSGDVDGDGLIGATDYVLIKNYITSRGKKSLSEAQKIAADYDNDNEVGATDYVRIKNDIIRRKV